MVEIDDEGLYTEQRVADSLGVSRAAVKAVRDEKLEEGAGWTKVRNAVVLTQEGLDTVLAELAPSGGNGQKIDEDGPEGDGKGSEAGEGEKGTPAEAGAENRGDSGVDGNGVCKKIVGAAPQRAVVRAVKVPRNPRIVVGEIVEVCDGEPSEGPASPRTGPVMGQEVRVRVRSNANFIPGMELPCYREAWDVWVLDRPCPRWRGRW